MIISLCDLWCFAQGVCFHEKMFVITCHDNACPTWPGLSLNIGSCQGKYIGGKNVYDYGARLHLPCLLWLLFEYRIISSWAILPKVTKTSTIEAKMSNITGCNYTWLTCLSLSLIIGSFQVGHFAQGGKDK